MLPSDLQSWTKKLVNQYNFQAGKKMGQHFLIDEGVLSYIIKTANLKPQQKVLEIGGGLGVLTLALLKSGAQVVTVELDSKLAVGLKKLASAGSNLKVLQGDILKFKPEVLKQELNLSDNESFVVVANLPYEISCAFLRQFLSGTLRPESMTLLLQKEVGERLVAPPGEKSLISILADLACTQKNIVRLVSPASFWPEPRVESCLIKLDLHSKINSSPISVAEEKIIWQLCRLGFAARRKMLFHNLLGGLHLDKSVLESIFVTAQVPRQARAQELGIEQWASLAREYQKMINSIEK